MDCAQKMPEIKERRDESLTGKFDEEHFGCVKQEKKTYHALRMARNAFTIGKGNIKPSRLF